jgi:hypothetical protein
MRVFPEGPTVQVATAEPGSVSFIKLARACCEMDFRCAGAAPKG